MLIHRRPIAVLVFASCAMPIAERKDVRWLTLVDYLEALRVAVNAEPCVELSDKRGNAMTRLGADLPSKNLLRS